MEIPEYPQRESAVSTITIYELTTGALKSGDPEKSCDLLDKFQRRMQLLDFDLYSAQEAARVRRDLEWKGTPIGPCDLLIAGIALSNGLTLITNNTREFERIEGLRVEKWVVE